MGITEALYLVDARLGSYVPKLDHSIVADAAKLGVLDRVESYLLDPSQVALELGRETDIGLLRIPCHGCP